MCSVSSQNLEVVTIKSSHTGKCFRFHLVSILLVRINRHFTFIIVINAFLKSNIKFTVSVH